jgi:hypothetical protein
VNVDGSNLQRVTNTFLDETEPAFSRDSSKIAFVGFTNPNYRIYVMNADGSGVVQVSDNTFIDADNPAFSPDGSKVAFEAQGNIWVTNADGSGGTTQLTTAGGWDPSFSRDGSQILYSSAQDTPPNTEHRVEIYRMNSNGTGQTRITNTQFNGEYHPAFSPNGSKIVYQRFPPHSSRGEIWIMNSDGSGQTMIFSDPVGFPFASPSWGGQLDSNGDGRGDACQNTSPVARCQNVTVSAGSNCQANASIDNGSSDAEDGFNVTLSQSPAGPYSKGNTLVTLTVTDSGGKTNSCQATVTVVDNTAPTINCSAVAAQSANADASCQAIVPDVRELVRAQSSDNCTARASLTITQDPPQGAMVSGAGSHPILVMVSDGANTNSCTVAFNVVDNIPPVIHCPASNIIIPATPAGSCTAVQTYTVTATDNCSAVTPVCVPPSGSAFSLGTTTVNCSVADAAGNTDNCSFTVTVQKIATLSSVTVTPSTQQYSDRVTFEATLAPASCTAGGVPASMVTFYVGTQNMGTATLGIVGGVLKGALQNVPLLEPTPIGTAPTGQLAPGARTVTAVFSGVNPNFIVGSPTTTLNVTAEDARATYTGACFASTSSATSNTGTVTLSATIKDISATPDAAGDTDPGDIRNAKVTFVDRDNGNVLAANVPVGLVSLGDTTTGTATINVALSTGPADSKSFTVGIIVVNYYTRNASEDDTVVTLSKPLGTNFITGGGYLTLTNSSGLYAGGVGTKCNFGFNVKYNKSNTNLQGNMNIIVRNGGRVYQIKATSLTSLAANPLPNLTGTATFNAKANIQDITDPLNVISIDGGATLQAKMTDLGQPGNADSIAITVWNRGGGLWFASNWDGTKTIEQILGGGNLIVR